MGCLSRRHLGACAFLAATSIRLFRRDPGALQFAGWLRVLEFFGAVLLTFGMFVQAEETEL